jgi:hypothetical protein
MSISITSKQAHSTNELPIQQSLSSHEISEKISSIDALEIELLSRKIITRIMKNLGDTNVNRIEQKINNINLEKSPSLVSMMAALYLALEGMGGEIQLNIEGRKPTFLSKKDANKFMLEALSPMQKEIANSFSTPSIFLEDGICFQISDQYEPMGFVSKAAETIGVDLTFQIPHTYRVRLKLDEQLTQKKSDLVFSLTGESRGIEISKETFTIKKLEEEFRS